MNETFLQKPGLSKTEERAAMIVLFPLFGLGVTSIPYSVAYLWTLLALAAGSLVTLLLVLLLHKRRSLHYEEEQ